MGSTIISKDGETLYYLAAFEGGYDLWKMNLRKKETRLLHKMDAGWADMQLDKDGKSLFLLGSHKMQKMDTSSDALTPITFQVDAKMDLAAEREYMFDHVYRQQQKRFYNTNMHGVDWDKMTAAYRRFLPHIDNNYDFAELLSETYLTPAAVSIPKGNPNLLPAWDCSSTGTTRARACSLPK